MQKHLLIFTKKLRVPQFLAAILNLDTTCIKLQMHHWSRLILITVNNFMPQHSKVLKSPLLLVLEVWDGKLNL